MSTESGTYTLFGGDTVASFPEFARPRLGRDIAELSQLLEVYSATERGKDRVRDNALRDGINTIAWQLAETIVWARICGTSGSGSERVAASSVSLEERLFVDVGFVGEEVCGVPRTELARPSPETGDQIPKIELMHDYVNSVAGEIFKAFERDNLRRMIAAKEHEVQSCAAMVEQVQREHDLLLRSMTQQERLFELQRRIDQLLPLLGQTKITPSRQHTQDTLRQEKKLIEGWNRLRNGQNELIETYKERKDLTDSHNQCFGAMVALKKAERETVELREQYEARARETERFTDQDVASKLHQEFSSLRRILRRANKQDAKAVPQFYLESRPVWLPRDVSTLLTEILEWDKRMGSAWAGGKWAMPRLLVIPGTGSAVYDKTHETIWIPVVTHEQGFCSLRRCIGVHRFHQAHAEQESFRRLEPFQHLKEASQIADAFAWAYDIYLGREVKGFRKLPTDVRKWFRLHLMQPP
jgi:hypothetical protein